MIPQVHVPARMVVAACDGWVLRHAVVDATPFVMYGKTWRVMHSLANLLRDALTVAWIRQVAGTRRRGDKLMLTVDEALLIELPMLFDKQKGVR